MGAVRVCMILKSDFESLKYDSRVLREAGALIGAGYRVSFVLYGDRDAKKPYEGADVYIAGMETERRIKKYKALIPGKGLIGRFFFKLAIHLAARFFDREYCMKTVKIAESCGAHIYHCHDIETLPIGIKLKKRMPVKVVYDSHELWSESNKCRGFKGAVTKLLITAREKRMIRKADMVVTVNDSLARLLEARYRIKGVRVILNVPERVDVPTGEDLLRHDLGMRKCRKIVLYLGALMEGRGLENLLEAWEYVNPDIALVIMGYGPLSGAIKNRITAAGLEGRVFIRDAVAPRDVLKYAASADLGMVSSQNTCLSYYYSSPNKMWEYIAAGVPILASDFPEMKKCAIDEEMGLVMNPDSPRDIAEKINFLLHEENRDSYMQMKKNCVTYGANKYNWGLEKEKLLEIYKGLSPAD